MYPRVKEIASRQYVYLVEGVREGQKVRQKTVAYLGPLALLSFGIPSSVRKRAERRAKIRIDWDNVREQIAKIPVRFDEIAGSRDRKVTVRLMARFQESPPTKIKSTNNSKTPRQ